MGERLVHVCGLHLVQKLPSGDSSGGMAVSIRLKYSMTSKEKAIGVIQSLADSASLDDVIDRLDLLRKVEIAEQQADNNEVIEHEVFMKQMKSKLYNARR